MLSGEGATGHGRGRVSSTILHFTPKAELGPQANLEAFVQLCRESEVLGAKRQFEQSSWEIGHLKGHNKTHRAIFSTMEAASSRSDEPLLPEPFLSFSKAALVYLHDQRPVVSQSVRVAAFRVLEAALRESNKGSRPTAVNTEVLDRAVELARESNGPGVAYRVAGQLVLIADLMREKGFISMRQAWVHGLKKPSELGSRISKEALEARQKKLPSAAALRALGGIFQQATKPRDVLVTSYTALMTSAPERINEVLRLKRNCFVHGDGRFAGKLGLRWPGSKGAEDTTKWFPTEMAPVAEQAVKTLLKLTSPAHELVKWYTRNPGKLYLHEGAEHLRGREVLSNVDIGLILWGRDDPEVRNSANTWATKTCKLEPVPLGGRRVGYRFADVETAVLSMLPKTFPYVPGAPDLRLEDALGVIRINETHDSRSTHLCMFKYVAYGDIAQPLVRHDGRPSIFDDFDYQEDDGSPIELNSHSLRHYLNMLAQMGGMSSAEIALFSGRKDVSQNRAYDHMTSDEVQEPISRALQAGMNGNLVAPEPARTRPLIRRSNFQLSAGTAAHTTEYGWCMHDFASEPCQLHRDCINCEEQVCIKGEAHKEANLRSLKAETELLLKAAKEALSEAEYGADAWVAHQTQTLERVEALLKILEDPQVAPGARVRLDFTGAALITEAHVRPNKFIRSRDRKTLK